MTNPHDFVELLAVDPLFEATNRYVREALYVGLTNLNTGYDSPKIIHVSPEDFAVVIDRCTAVGVAINGIEAFDISNRPVGLLDVVFAGDGEVGLTWAQRVVESYKGIPDVTLCATFKVPQSLVR